MRVLLVISASTLQQLDMPLDALQAFDPFSARAWSYHESTPLTSAAPHLQHSHVLPIVLNTSPSLIYAHEQPRMSKISHEERTAAEPRDPVS